MALVFSGIDSAWGPGFEAKRLAIFFFRIFHKIPAVGYSEDLKKYTKILKLLVLFYRY